MSDPITGETPAVVLQAAPTDKTVRRTATRDILLYVVALIALCNSLYAQVHKASADKTNATAIATNTARQLCAGRYQDAVDQADTDRSAAIGELVVIITQIPPGPEREAAVGTTVTALDVANKQSKVAVTEKAKYNKDGRPLPCPIDQT